MIEKVDVPEGACGVWKIARFVIDQKASDKAAMYAVCNRGRGFLPAGTYTKLTRAGTLVMSDTPDEMHDHRPFVRCARGRVLITGLGLGMVVGAVLAKPDVTAVTVVEIDADLIALVGPHYAGDPRLTIVHADAFAWTPPKHTRYDVAWHDIWDTICSDNLPEMHRLKRKYGRYCNNQGCWAEYQCKRMRDR